MNTPLQQWASPGRAIAAPPITTVHLCIPDDQLVHAEELPSWALCMPEGAPLPRKGDVLYLSSTSAWAVILVIHERLSRDMTRVEVWLEYTSCARHSRSPDNRIQ